MDNPRTQRDRQLTTETMRAFHLDTVDSTNEEAKRLIRKREVCEPFYLIAREQTAGRGSRGRTWLSPKDAGIYLTVVELPDAAEVAPTTAITLAAGIACVEVLEETVGVEVQLKPINDLYVDGCKLGGILTETVIQNGLVTAVITGVGINVRRTDRGLPGTTTQPICLQDMVPPYRFARLDLDALTATLVVKIRAWNAVVFAGRIAEVQNAWERNKIST